MPFDELDDLLEYRANDLFQARLMRDGKAEIARRQRRTRQYKMVSVFALAASLMFGVWLGISDLAMVTGNASVDDITLIAESVDGYGASFGEWELLS